MVSVELDTRVCRGTVVVELRGELDIADAASVAAAVSALAAPGQCLIIDLAALEFIDCGGLRALLRARKLSRLAGGDVLLAAPRAHVLRVITLTGLAATGGIHGSVAGAVASADRGAAARGA